MEEPQTENAERTEAQLVEQVKNQVEYYFSKENLLVDPFLTSQMDAQMCVPISIVMKFAKLKALTHDESILRRALVDSTAVTVIDNKIKANIKPPGRSTIILREIPSDAPAEEVKEIFNYPGAKAVSSIRSEIGDTWFVTMESEEDAKDTTMDLRLKKRTFRGAAVKARLKTETVVRSFFPVQAGIAPVVPFAGIMAGGMPMPVVDMRAYGYMGMQMPVMPVDASAEAGAAAPAESAPAAAADTRSSPGKAAASSATPSSGTKEARAKGQNAPAAGKGSSSNTQGQRRQDGNNATGAAANARGNTKGGAKEKKEEPVVRPTIELNLASFPPLGGEDQPIPTPGYKGPFHKYSGDEIINIAKGVKEAKLPESLNPSQHPLAMTVEANKDLLKRQRTFSIDETREQLRQGRPVQRDAIISGKVDSRSLYYGDEPSAPAAAPKKESAPAPAAAPVSSPSAAKKAAPAAAAPATEARAVAADVVEQVTASAANLAVSNPTIVEAMNSSTPQKITPSTWAAMIKSSAAATDSIAFSGAKPAVPVAAVRTPAKEKPAAAASSTTKAAKTGDKEKEGEGKTRRKNSGDNSRKADAGKEPKEGGRRKSGSNAEAPGTPSRSEKTAEGAEAATSKPAEAPAQASWGGKASFANILKLNAEAEAFQPTAPAASPAKAAAPAAASTATPSSNGERRRPQASTGSSAPVKPSASAVAAASKRDAAPKTTTDASGEWSTSTGKSRSSREASSGREHKDKEPCEGARPSAGSGSTSTSGANAKGVWAKETLPALPEEKK